MNPVVIVLGFYYNLVGNKTNTMSEETAMGATVNTLTLDKGDILALEQAKRNVRGKCKVKSLTLTTRETSLASYVVNANFTKVVDNYTGLVVNTREWKRVWSCGYPVRTTSTQVRWTLYRHYGVGRLEDDPRVLMYATLVNEGKWQVVVGYAKPRGRLIPIRQWNIDACNEGELVSRLTPAALVAAKFYSGRYGRHASRLVDEPLPEAWNADLKSAVSSAGGWQKV